MIKVGIIGGTGYTGIELLRILHGHPNADVVSISSRSLDGKRVDEVFSSLKKPNRFMFLLSKCRGDKKM
jgi:N-acetyl-gamma-glutamyl-phosphate reductase